MPQVLIKKITAYTYNELSQAAKEKALSEHCQNFWVDDNNCDMITDLMKDELTQNGYDPDFVDISWSLSYCQGDGVSLKGKIHPSDLSKVVERFFPRDLLKVHQIKRLIEDGFIENPIEFCRVYGYRGLSVDGHLLNCNDDIVMEEVEYKLSQWDDEDVLMFFQELPEEDRYVQVKEPKNWIDFNQQNNFKDFWLQENGIVDYFWTDNKFFAFVGNAVMAVEMKIPSEFLDPTEWNWVSRLAETPDQMREALKDFYTEKIGNEIESIAESLFTEIQEAIAEDIEELEKKLAKLGYEEIEYQTSEKSFIESANSMEWLFDECGDFIPN